MYLITRIHKLRNQQTQLSGATFYRYFMAFYDSLCGIEQIDHKSYASRFKQYLKNNHNININFGGK